MHTEMSCFMHINSEKINAVKIDNLEHIKKYDIVVLVAKDIGLEYLPSQRLVDKLSGTVAIVHLPTSISCLSRIHRSQHKNRNQCLIDLETQLEKYYQGKEK